MKKYLAILTLMLTLLTGCGSEGNTYILTIGSDEVYVEMKIQELIEKGYSIDVNMEEELPYNTYYKDMILVTKDKKEIMKIQIGNFSLEDGKIKDGTIKRIEYSGKVILNGTDFTVMDPEEAKQKLGDLAELDDKYNTVDIIDDTLYITMNYSKDNKLESIYIDKKEK